MTKLLSERRQYHTMNKFQEAIRNGDTDTVRHILRENPAQIKEATPDGFTPLMQAVMSSERTAELVELLLEAGAEVNAQTPEGYTALHCSIDVNGPSRVGDVAKQIVHLLVEHGAEVDAKQHWGWTPLMLAVLDSAADLVEALLSLGANSNLVYPQTSPPAEVRGHTLLMVAVPSPDVLSLLLKTGADLNAEDEYGWTVLEYAEEILSLYGADANVSRSIGILESAETQA